MLERSSEGMYVTRQARDKIEAVKGMFQAKTGPRKLFINELPLYSSTTKRNPLMMMMFSLTSPAYPIGVLNENLTLIVILQSHDLICHRKY